MTEATRGGAARRSVRAVAALCLLVASVGWPLSHTAARIGGPVLVSFGDHGVHLGDLVALPPAAAAVWLAWPFVRHARRPSGRGARW